MNLPNIISLGRLLSVPVIVWLILSGEMGVAVLVFAGAGVSDAVDGYLAKRLNAQTQVGRYLDPIADKVLLVAVYLTLGGQGYLPLWLVILVVSRDFLIVGGVLMSFTMGLNYRVQPLLVSKVNTVAQIALAVTVLGELAYDGRLNWVSVVLVYVVALTTVLSGTGYLVQWVRSLSSEDTTI